MEIQTFKMRGNNESDFGCIWQAKKSFKRSCRNRRWSSPATESPIYLTWRHSQNKPHKIIPKVYCILYFISFIRSCHILQFENPVFKFNPLPMHKSMSSNQAFDGRLMNIRSVLRDLIKTTNAMRFQIMQIKFWQYSRGHRTIFPFIHFLFGLHSWLFRHL